MTRTIEITHNCEHADCTAIDAEAYQSPAGGEEYLCAEHAQDRGYCLGCHLFCAGTESFDFSEVAGFCYECIQELKAETGEDDDFEDEDDYDPMYDDEDY